MSHIVRELLIDRSNRDQFQFYLRCAACGDQWKSKITRFSKSGIVPESSGKQVVFAALYQREKEAALNRAVAEASGAFNTCPICRQLVCDCCFMICDDLDMCQSCAEHLQEKGELVASRDHAG